MALGNAAKSAPGAAKPRARRPAKQKATDAQLREAYADLKSCHAVAARFGMHGASAHERLAKMGLMEPIRVFTDAEKHRLQAEYDRYASEGRLDELAAIMGRTKPFLCRQAKALGLTSPSRPMPEKQRAGLAERTKAALARNGHPRGMAGKTHSAAAKAAVGAAHRAAWERMTEAERDARLAAQTEGRRLKGTPVAPRPNATWKAGWREIGGVRIYARSRWEANYARYLQWLQERHQIAKWEHEPHTFWFEGIKRGALSYLPDFRVTESNGAVAFHEVKGWMDDRSKTKIARMARQFPDVRLIVIDKKAYRKIAEQVAPFIKGWEA